MKEWAGKRYWLVGASEGLGRALAAVMSRAGVELVLSARSEETLNELAGTLPGKTHVVPCDISDMDQVKAAAESAGELDGVVMLAGVYWPMAAPEWDPAKASAKTEVTINGTIRAIGYGASKAAVMSLAESMEADLRNSGVDVQLLNPGFVKPRLTDQNEFAMPFIMEPEEAAREMFEHMSTDRFKKSFPWMFSLLIRGTQFLTDWK